MFSQISPQSTVACQVCSKMVPQSDVELHKMVLCTAKQQAPKEQQVRTPAGCSLRMVFSPTFIAAGCQKGLGKEASFWLQFK